MAIVRVLLVNPDYAETYWSLRQMLPLVRRRWLVAPYGNVGWVRNARAAGRVTLSRGRRAETLPITEVAGEERGHVLTTYVTRVPVTRPFFDARPDAPVEVFVAEGDRHPVFRLGEPGA